MTGTSPVMGRPSIPIPHNSAVNWPDRLNRTADRNASALFRRGDAGAVEGGFLAAGQHALVEIVDQLVEQAGPVDARLQVQEHRAEPDRGAIHEDEGARRGDAAELADVAMDVVDDLAAINAAALFLDHAGAVVE